MHYIYRYENMDVLTFPLVTIALSFAAPKSTELLKVNKVRQVPSRFKCQMQLDLLFPLGQ
jgi:hypothetical protein